MFVLQDGVAHTSSMKIKFVAVGFLSFLIKICWEKNEKITNSILKQKAKMEWKTRQEKMQRMDRKISRVFKGNRRK